MEEDTSPAEDGELSARWVALDKETVLEVATRKERSEPLGRW
jgi:hypothetical protein